MNMALLDDIFLFQRSIICCLICVNIYIYILSVAYLFFNFELVIRKAVYLTNQASIHFDWKNVSVRYIIFHVFVSYFAL